MNERNRDHLVRLRPAEPVVEEGMHDVARARHVSHQHIEGERAAPHHRRFDPERQTAIQPIAFEDFRILVEPRSEEHTSELQSLMRISYAVFCLKKKTNYEKNTTIMKNTK